MQKRTYVYNEGYHLKTNQVSSSLPKDVGMSIIRCDLCNDILKQVDDNFEERMNILDEIDNSFESDYDKSTYECGPMLILCDYCAEGISIAILQII